MKSSTVSFLVPDISAPSLGIAIRFSEMLKDHYSTEIVGPDLGRGICSMYKRVTSCKAVPCPRIYRVPEFWQQCRLLGDALTGDIIISIKAFAHTLPVALQQKRMRRAHVIAYLDEWDGAYCYDMSWSMYIKTLIKNIMYPLSEPFYPFVERLLPAADHVISTTTFLQKRFGGSVINLGVDTDIFKEQPIEEIIALKTSLGLSENKVIVFGGVARPHKGIELILDAILRIPQHNLHLLIVGPRTDYLKFLMADARYRGLISCEGDEIGAESNIDADRHSKMPLYLSLADVIVLPQLDSTLAKSQMPCKLFEAMAMAKPIVATNVSDLPSILHECGWIVPPGDVCAIANRIDWILRYPKDAQSMGLAARKKCLHCYDVKQSSQEIVSLISSIDME